MDTFGQRLVAARERNDLSQKELAERLGITPTRLNYWEKDKREPAIEMIKSIAQILDTDTNYLVGYQPQKNAPLYSSEAMKLARDYDSLDSHGQRMLRLVAEEEKARCEGLVAADRQPMIQAAARSGGVTEIENITPDEVTDEVNIP